LYLAIFIIIKCKNNDKIKKIKNKLTPMSTTTKYSRKYYRIIWTIKITTYLLDAVAKSADKGWHLAFITTIAKADRQHKNRKPMHALPKILAKPRRFNLITIIKDSRQWTWIALKSKTIIYNIDTQPSKEKVRIIPLSSPKRKMVRNRTIF
jgi:hypothetical protein